ncbi:hypothetical protein [Aneurinibacillus tyrosinisolvens]|uniref:hypothetical protein n=1 Tax=Aneurinibacillus tyrosinisolvens TaxID=1443435 RepID=UPI00063F2A44|nr:hypothetical protein [Aneurinibacillus tyrosinisolvens]
MNIKRNLNEENVGAKYKVVGVSFIKPIIDSFSGSLEYQVVCRLSNAAKPIPFMSYFYEAQRVAF